MVFLTVHNVLIIYCYISYTADACVPQKATVWSRPNKGVEARRARDVELEAVSRPTLESARAALERKALIYDKLKKGKSGGLSDKQYEELLVDVCVYVFRWYSGGYLLFTPLLQFDSKPADGQWSSDSEDVDESVTVPKQPSDEVRSSVQRSSTADDMSLQDDPIVEYEDEFGRLRTARKSEVPRHLMQPLVEEEAVEDE